MLASTGSEIRSQNRGQSMMTVLSILPIFEVDWWWVAFTTLLSLCGLAMVQLLDEKAAAKLLNVTPAALRRWRREQRCLKYIRIGRLFRYRDSDIEEFISKNTEGVRTNEK